MFVGHVPVSKSSYTATPLANFAVVDADEAGAGAGRTVAILVNVAGQCNDAGLNFTKVRDPKVDDLLNATDRTSDPIERASLYNQADKELATNSVTVIPLFQKPTQLGYRDTISGVQDNPTQDGFTWNIEDWTYTG